MYTHNERRYVCERLFFVQRLEKYQDVASMGRFYVAIVIRMNTKTLELKYISFCSISIHCGPANTHLENIQNETPCYLYCSLLIIFEN